MAIESETPGEPPKQIQQLLAIAPLSDPIRPGGHGRRLAVLTRGELLQFMGAEMEVEGYTPRLRAAPLRAQPDSDLLGSPEGPGEGEMRDEETHERLLAWMSACGEGSSQQFRSACAVLHLGNPLRLLRSLRLLGHVELSSDGRRWSIAPLTFVSVHTPSGSAFVLCGARDRVLLDRLSALNGFVRDQQNGHGPSRLCVRAAPEVESSLQSIPGAQVLADAAMRLCRVLPTFADWSRSLPRLAGVVPSRHEMRRFDGHEFVHEPFAAESGFYEFWPKSENLAGAARPHLSAYYDSTSGEWIHGEWYALRFLAAPADPPFIYDAGTRRAICNRRQRLPELYERVLVLSSGLLPWKQGESLVYESIEPSTAELLASLLSPQL